MLNILGLVNGDQIIGDCIEDDNGICIKYPMSLVMDPVSGGLGMMPYLSMYTGELSKERVIDINHVVTNLREDELMDEIKTKYAEYRESVLKDLEA